MPAYRKTGIMLAAAGLTAGLLFLALDRPTRRVEHLNGTDLELLDITAGAEPFRDGSPVEKLLGRVIPAGGIQVGGIRLQRPAEFGSHEAAPLTAWLSLKDPALTGKPFSEIHDRIRAMRVLVFGGPERILENPPGWIARASSNEVLVAIPLKAFPRNEHRLGLKVLSRSINHGGRPWEKFGQSTWASFEFRNPLYRNIEPRWKAISWPATNRIGDLEIILANMEPGQTDRRQLTNLSVSAACALTFRIAPGPCSICECRILDEEGNSCEVTGTTLPARDASPAEFRTTFDYSLEPDRVWLVEVKIVRADFYSSERSRTFPESEKMTATITAPLRDVRMTNAPGAAYICKFNGQELFVRSASGPDKPYLILLRATDANGKVIAFGGGTGWRQSASEEKWQEWFVTKPLHSWTNITFEFAAPEVVTTRFFIKLTSSRHGGTGTKKP